MDCGYCGSVVDGSGGVRDRGVLPSPYSISLAYQQTTTSAALGWPERLADSKGPDRRRRGFPASEVLNAQGAGSRGRAMPGA